MPQSFDEAFPGGFEECVSTLGQEPSVDDPEALCGWLQEHGFEAIENASPDSILAGLRVEYVSVVDEPAQDSEWLLAKSAEADEADWTPGDNRLGDPAKLVLRKEEDEEGSDEEETPVEDEDDGPAERKVWAAVLVPGRSDAHGDLVPEPEIESAAHSYMKNYRKVDADHSLFEGEGTPIESYIVRNGPDEFTTPDGETVSYPEGTWIMGVELEKDAWKRVENGELTGFSIYGGAASLDPDALLTEKQRKALLEKAEDRLSEDELSRLAGAVADELETRGTTPTMGDSPIRKEVPDGLLDLLDAYFNDFDGTPSDTSVEDVLLWTMEEGETVEVGGVTVGDESGDDDEVEEADDSEDSDEDEDDDSEEKAQKDDADDTMDDELQDTLGEIRDTTNGIAKSVEEHGSRLDDLRSDVEEVQKEVGLLDGEEDEQEAETEDEDAAKSEDEPSELELLREDLTEAGVLEKDASDEEEEVVRKGAKSGTSPDDVEKSSGDGKISTGTEGITAAGRVD